jgi:hypothetical protein
MSMSAPYPAQLQFDGRVAGGNLTPRLPQNRA